MTRDSARGLATEGGRLGTARPFVLLAVLVWASLAWALGGDFTLADTDGKPFRLADQRGRVVLMYFGYTSCPDLCPAELALLRDVLERLGDRRARVVPVFVSVDPARDTPGVLRDYARKFDAGIVPLSGSDSQLGRIARAYGAPFRPVGDRSRGAYVVDHSTALYVIDRNGRLARILPQGTPVAEVVGIVERLLGPRGG